MNRRNYMREMDRVLSAAGDTAPTLLLHSCCGPCSSAVLEQLTQHFRVTLLWYNPNLYPEAEFDRRLATQRELLQKAGLADEVPVLVLPYRPEEYYTAIRGLEQAPEGGERCTACFRLRLRECAKTAAAQGFDYFCTTLTVSRHKDPVRINALGEAAAKEFGAVWLPNDFKKRGGEMRSQVLAEQYGLYRQLYCGCVFSMQGRSPEELRDGIPNRSPAATAAETDKTEEVTT